jgi:hypothetical protein
LEPKDIISSGLLELYAAGIASEEEALLVQQYTKLYPEVKAELAEMEAGMESYAQAFAVEPDPSVKDKIFSRINNTNKPVLPATSAVTEPQKASAVIVKISPYQKFAAAASVILLAGSIALNIIMYNQQKDTAKNLQQTQQELSGLKEENKLIEGDMQVVQSKYSKPVALKGLDAAPDAAAKIFWMENTGEVYIDPSNLPEAPQGKQYQLWGIVDGKPVDGGMILTSKKGNKYRIQKMKTFGKVEAFAVTLENEPGNKAPKGPMFVMGKM